MICTETDLPYASAATAVCWSERANQQSIFWARLSVDPLCVLICEWAPVSKTVALFVTLLVKSEKLGGKKKKSYFLKVAVQQ